MEQVFTLAGSRLRTNMHLEGMGDLYKYENEEPKIVHKPKINPGK